MCIKSCGFKIDNLLQEKHSYLMEYASIVGILSQPQPQK